MQTNTCTVYNKSQVAERRWVAVNLKTCEFFTNCIEYLVQVIKPGRQDFSSPTAVEMSCLQKPSKITELLVLLFFNYAKYFFGLYQVFYNLKHLSIAKYGRTRNPSTQKYPMRSLALWCTSHRWSWPLPWYLLFCGYEARIRWTPMLVTDRLDAYYFRTTPMDTV